MLSSHKTPPRLTTLIIMTGVSLLSLNMFMPALPEMATTFQVEYDVINLAVAGYLGVAALMQIFFGPLSDRYGRRPVLLRAMMIFFVASVGGLLATNIWVFLIFRFLQSAVVAGMVISRAIIRDIATEEKAASLLGYVAMVMALAPMLGPVLGGAMADMFGWRAIYWFYTLVGAITLLLVWTDVGETNQNTSKSMMSQFQTYPELFRSRRFWGYTGGLTFSVSAFYAFISGAPLVAAQNFQLSTSMLGAGIGSISGGFMLGNFISGRYTRRIGLRQIMTIGRVFAVIGPLGALILSMLGLGSVYIYFGGVILVGFGNGLTLPGANAGVMSVRPKLAGSAAGISGAITIAGGAVVTWSAGNILVGDNSLYVHLALIAACSLGGLLCFAYVNRLDRHEGTLKDA